MPKGKPLVKMKRTRKRKPHNKEGTIVTVDHVEGRKSNIGSDERMAEYIRRAFTLRATGHTYQEVAHKIAEEFKLVTVPHLTTACKWVRMGFDLIEEDTKELAKQLRYDQFNDLEKMKAKYLALATVDQLTITRWVHTKEGDMPQLDENAIEEQMKAADITIKIMARQAKLMGLDLSDAQQDKDQKTTIADLQKWLMGEVQNPTIKPIEGKVIASDLTLELRHGIPDVEDDYKEDQV